MKMALIIILLLILSACSKNESYQELKNMAREEQVDSMQIIKPLPNFKRATPVTYQITNLRDPFQANLNQFNFAKNPKEPLATFPLNDLRLVGTMVLKQKFWALIAAPNGLLYQVTQGAHLGKNQGIIVAVKLSELQIEEKNLNNAERKVSKLILFHE